MALPLRLAVPRGPTSSRDGVAGAPSRRRHAGNCALSAPSKATDVQGKQRQGAERLLFGREDQRLCLAGSRLFKRRGRDLNPRRTQRPETVFETVRNNQHGRGSAECLQALCKHYPSERCRRVPNQRITPKLRRLLEPVQRHRAVHTHDVAQLCKPEVTGSIPVRSTPFSEAVFGRSRRKSAASASRPRCATGYLARPLVTVTAGSGEGLCAMARVSAGSQIGRIEGRLGCDRVGG
jgi:hypothetical protein